MISRPYFDSNVHEAVAELIMDQDPALANLAIIIFGKLVSEDSSLTEAN